MDVPCVDIEILSDIIKGNLAKKEKEKIFAHIQTCSDCFERVNSALLIFSDKELDTWDELPEKQVKSIVKKFRKKTKKPLLSRKKIMNTIIKWRDDMTPDFPLVYGYARNAAAAEPMKKPKTEYLHIEKDFSEVETIIFFEKYSDRFNMHIKMNNDPSGTKNVRFNLISKNGQVSRLLKEGHASFEDFPFGAYELIAVHKQVEKGTYNFQIDERGLDNGEGTLS